MFRQIMHVLLVVLGIQLATSNSATANVEYPSKAFEGTSIVTRLLWHGYKYDDPRQGVKELIANLKQLDVKRVVVPICIDHIAEKGNCSNPYAYANDDVRFNVIQQLVSAGYHVTIRFQPERGKKANGSFVTFVEDGIRNDKYIRQNYFDLLHNYALQYSNFSKDELSFNILNEPHFRKVDRLYLREYTKIARQAVEIIRKQSPDRIIIVQSIAKSAFAHAPLKNKILGFGPNKLVKVLPYDNIIYGFNFFEPNSFTEQRNGARSGLSWNSKWNKQIERDAKTLAKWSNKKGVPVIITETGAVTYFDGKTSGPSTIKERAMFGEQMYNNFVDKYGIGLTWWAMEKDKSLFVYCRAVSFNSWYPQIRAWDIDLLKSLHLLSNKTEIKTCS